MQKSTISTKKKAHLQNIYDNYLHSYETRSQEQITKTTEKIKNISAQNLQRIQKIDQKQISLQKQKYSNHLFICLSGIPAFDKQFQFLQLPGQSIQFILTDFDFKLSQQQRIKRIPQCRLQTQANRLHKIIQENKQKQIILIYHSFGTYILSCYLYKYGAKQIKGLIQLGPAPIRHYLYITEVLNFAEKYTQQDLIVKMDQIVGKDFKQLMTKINEQIGVKWEFFPTNSLGSCFISYFKSKQMRILFDLNRRYPEVLKLIIFGEEDNLFQIDLLAERAQFYSQQKLQNQPELKKKFQEKYQIKIDNIQQKFIYSIPKAKHSLHLQKKNQQIIKKAVYQYLKMLQ